MTFKVGDRVKLKVEEIESIKHIIDERLGESPYYIVARIAERFYDDEDEDEDGGGVLYIHTPKNNVIEMAWYAYRFELYMKPIELPEGLFEL